MKKKPPKTLKKIFKDFNRKMQSLIDKSNSIDSITFTVSDKKKTFTKKKD